MLSIQVDVETTAALPPVAVWLRGLTLSSDDLYNVHAAAGLSVERLDPFKFSSETG